jgi:hypothetical protein
VPKSLLIGLVVAGLLVIALVVGAKAFAPGDMFSGRDWMVQGPPHSIQGQEGAGNCVRVYGGNVPSGYVAVCRDLTANQYSCWAPAGGSASKVTAWSRMDDGDGNCRGAVGEVVYQNSLGPP